MAVLLFVLAIMASFLVVRLGSVALELTGMEPHQARFQALSAFSGSGFTTRESELIVTHPARRKVVRFLIIGGNAGLVTMIATLASSIGSTSTLREGWHLFGDRIRVPGGLIPYVKVIFFILLLMVLYRLAHTRPVARVITRALKRFVVRQGLVQRVSFEEVLLGTEGYGINKVEISEDNPLLGKTLIESGLRARGILVLMIERGDQVIVPAGAHNDARLGDRLTMFGPLEAIRDAAVAEAERDVPMPEEDEDEED